MSVFPDQGINRAGLAAAMPRRTDPRDEPMCTPEPFGVCSIMSLTYTMYMWDSRGGTLSTAVADYDSVASARSKFKDMLDRSEHGHVVTIRRGNSISVLTSAERLRDYFAKTVSPRTKVFQEGGRWVVLLERRPFVSEGTTVDEALIDLVASLREYAEDWDARLSGAPNHEQNWALVQLVNLSSDGELLEWIEQGGDS